MKKFAAIFIVILVAGLWLMPVRRTNAQTEIDRVESEIAALETIAEMCAGELDKLQPPGAAASAEEWAKYEKDLQMYEECATNIENKLKWLRTRLGELLSRLPSATAPNEDPETKKLREKIKEWEKRRAAAEEKQKRLKARLEKLRKANKSKQPAPGFKAETTSSGGLSKTTFITPKGRILVYLPADMRAGDNISGTVVAEPNGNNQGERVGSLAALGDYQVMIGNEKVLVPKTITYQGTIFTILIPTPSAERRLLNSNLFVTLFKSDKSTGRSYESQDTFPTQWVSFGSYSSHETDKTRPQTPTPNDFNLPTIGQNGSSVEIKGPFDGNLRTTELRVGGQPVTTLAESPNSCIFNSPSQNFGPTDITLKENTVETKGTYRNLGLRLTAPKTSLLQGESTELTITVEGLKGIQQNVPLLLQKEGVVSMDGGDTQTVQIRPTDVRADGTFETKRTLTGLQAGVFGVTATVIDPAHRPIIIPLTENAKVNGFRVRKDGDKFVIEVDGVQSPITGKPVDGEHKLEHQCPMLSKVPYVGSLFLKNGIGRTNSNCLMIMITPKIIIQKEEE